jgi:hypothetical protein
MKYLRQAIFRKEVYLAHRSGSSKACHWHQLSTGEDLMADGITIAGRQEEEITSQRGSQGV